MPTLLALLAAALPLLPLAQRQTTQPARVDSSARPRSIAAALRTARVGDTVLVAGRASVASGILQQRGTYVALQDDSAGLWIFRRAPATVVREGDSVEARGVVQFYRGSVELIATQLNVVPTLAQRATVPDTQWPNGTLREGRLMRVRGIAGERGISEGGRWLRLRRQGSRDSMTLWVPSGHGDPPVVSDVREGDVLDVTGIGTVYQDNPNDPPVWQIVARRPADVQTIGIPRRITRLLQRGLLAIVALTVLVVGATRLLTRRQARVLRETEDRYRQLLALSPDAVLVHDAERVLFANAAAARLLGATDEHALAGRPVASFVGPDQRDALAASAGVGPSMRPAGHRMRTTFITSDGSTVDVEVATSPCRYHDREASVIVARDIGPQLRYERDLRELALLDELTGLHNRRGFFMFAEAELRRLRERGSHAVLAFADLDGLKRINDAHGHAAGDEALRVVARALREVVGEQGLAARWSGDEFVALIPDAAPAAAPISLAHPVVTGEHLGSGSGDSLAADAFEQRLAAVLARHGATLPYSVSASVGVRRLGPEAGETLAAALAAADAGLYRRRDQSRHTPSRNG